MAYGFINVPSTTSADLTAIQKQVDELETKLDDLSYVVSLPTQNGQLWYTGSVQAPQWSNYDANKVTISGSTSGTNAGTYTVTFTPVGDYHWQDGTNTAKQSTWTITRAPMAIPTQAGSLTYTGSAQSPSWNNYDSTKMTLSVTAQTNAGTYTATFTPGSNYQWSDNTTAAKSVNWTIGKATGSMTLSTTTLSVGTDASTFTVSRLGDGTITAVSSSTAICTVSVSGTTVTVTPVAEGTATVTVSCAAGTNYTAPAAQTVAVTVTFLRIYGVSWDGTSTTKLSRTDASANFTDPVPYYSGASSYSSPFDNLYPWNGMKTVEDSEAGTLVSIPKFWYKWTASGTTLKLQIANAETDGYSVSPAHADRGDGKGERDVVYVGRYHCGATAYKSVTGQKPKVSITRATARTNISALGDTIWQYDFAMFWTINMLYLVEFADWDVQAVIGYGRGNNSAVQAMGASDSMPYHTGTMQTSRATYGVGCQYRYIEGLWDNALDWNDGVYFSGSSIYCIKKPSSYSDSSGGTLTGTRPTSSGCISAWSIPTASGFGWALYPKSVVSDDTYTTYCADQCNYNSSGVVLLSGGYYYQNRNCGLFFLSGYSSASNSGSDVGCRLQKLP